MKKIALLLTGSLCSFGMSFSTYSAPLPAEHAQIYLDLLESNYDYTYATSHLHDLTGDGLSDLLISYESEDEEGIQTDIWQILDGELTPVVFEANFTDSLSIVSDEQGNAYLFSESNQDLALSGGALCHIYSYKDGGISPIYELSSVETFPWDEETRTYDTTVPLNTFIENGIPVQDALSSKDLFSEMYEKYQLEDGILIYETDDTPPEHVASVVEILEEVLRKAKYALYDPMNYQELLEYLPYTGDLSDFSLPLAQAEAFLQVLQDNADDFQELKKDSSQQIGFFHTSTSDMEEVEPDVFVTFFPLGDGSIGMLAHNTIYTWHSVTGLQQVHLPNDWNFRIFESENQEIYLEYYLSSPEDTYFYAGLFRTFRNGSLVDTGYKSFQWTTEDLSLVSDIIFAETGVDLSGKLNEVAGKTETSLGEPLYQLHFYQEQMVDNLPFNIHEKNTLLTCYEDDFPCYEGIFLPYEDVEALLERIVKNTEHYFGFSLISHWEDLIQAISNDLSRDFTADMLESLEGIYFLSDNLFYLVFEEEKESSGLVVGLGVKEGYEKYYLVDSQDTLKSEEELKQFVQNHLNQSNITINYDEMAECVTSEDFLLLLGESLNHIRGTAVNQIALSEITQYIEISLAQIGQLSIGSKDNYFEITSDLISDSSKLHQIVLSDFEKLLFQHQIILSRDVTTTTQIVVQNMDVEQAIHLHLDYSLLDLSHNCNLNILIAGSDYQISLSHLSSLLTENGFSIRLIPENGVTLQFEDGMGKVIPTLDVPVSITMHSDAYFSTVFQHTEDRLIPWGGQYDSKNKTISFSTFYSGKYEILDNSIEIADISHLEDSTKDAIVYLVSKGFFDATRGNFMPEDFLTRNDLAKILTTMFYVTDDSLSTSYKDVEESDPFYPYISATQKYKLLSGFTDTEFAGNLPVTVEQVLVLISRTLWEITGTPLPDFPEDYQFVGLSDGSSWAEPFLALAHREGILLFGEEISPKENLNREDAAVYFYRLFQILYPVSPVTFQIPVEYIPVIEPELEPEPEVIAPTPQGGIAPVRQDEFGINEKEFAMAAGAGVGLIFLLGFYRIVNRKKRKSKKKSSIILSMDELPEQIIDLEEVIEETEESSVPTYQEKETEPEETVAPTQEDTVFHESYDEVYQETDTPEEYTEPVSQNEPFVPPVVYPPEHVTNVDTEQLYTLEEQRPHIQQQLLIQSTVPS